MCLEAVVSISQDYGDLAAHSVSCVSLTSCCRRRKKRRKKKKKEKRDKRITAAVREQAVKTK